MIVKLRRRNARYRDLTPRQPYVVIGIEGDDYRILDDAGRPYLYPRGMFQVLDAREPRDWVSEYGEDGERYAYPAPLRSEERRVGKECRCRWWAYDEKKKR